MFAGRLRSARWHHDRFMQTDPIGGKDDLDLYAYAGNDPLNRTDPTGQYDKDTNWIGDLWKDVGSFIKDLQRQYEQDRQAEQLREARGFLRGNQDDIIYVSGHWQPVSGSFDSDIASWWRDFTHEYAEQVANGVPPAAAMAALAGGKTPTGYGTRLTNAQARDLAKWSGLKEVKDRSEFRSQGQPVFERNGRFFSPDTDGHSPGVWKEFDRSGDRIGTVDLDFNRIKD
jgi:hypothetical protein